MTLVIMKYILAFTDIISKKKTPVAYFFISVFNNYTISICKLYARICNAICLFLVSVRNVLDESLKTTLLTYKPNKSDFHSLFVVLLKRS